MKKPSEASALLAIVATLSAIGAALSASLTMTFGGTQRVAVGAAAVAFLPTFLFALAHRGSDEPQEAEEAPQAPQHVQHTQQPQRQPQQPATGQPAQPQAHTDGGQQQGQQAQQNGQESEASGKAYLCNECNRVFQDPNEALECDHGQTTEQGVGA